MDPTNQHRPLNLTIDAPVNDGWYLVCEAGVE